MRLLLVAPYYAYWHYGLAIKNIIVMIQTFVWFVWHFFSIGVLAKTLFAPWQRLDEEYSHKPFDLQAYFSTLAINSVMRITGAVIRLIFIAFGLLFTVLIIFAGIIVMIAWLLFPLLVIFLVILGLVMIIRPL